MKISIDGRITTGSGKKFNIDHVMQHVIMCKQHEQEKRYQIQWMK